MNTPYNMILLLVDTSRAYLSSPQFRLRLLARERHPQVNKIQYKNVAGAIAYRNRIRA
jgi:hypothetical protein